MASASVEFGQIETTAGLEVGLSSSLSTDVPGVTGPAGGCASDGKRWPKQKLPLRPLVGLDPREACEEFSWEASWSSLFSSSATRVVFWTFFARGGAGVWCPQGLLSLWHLFERCQLLMRLGDGGLSWGPYRSHLEGEGPGIHLDLAFAQVMQARGPLFFGSASAMAKKQAQVW